MIETIHGWQAVVFLDQKYRQMYYQNIVNQNIVKRVTKFQKY